MILTQNKKLKKNKRYLTKTIPPLAMMMLYCTVTRFSKEKATKNYESCEMLFRAWE